jgi:hypothetical protein
LSLTSARLCSHQYEVNRDVNKQKHFPIIRPLLPEIEAFAKHNHFNVLHPVLRLAPLPLKLFIERLITGARLLALGLELPEETFVDMHKFEAVGESSGIEFFILYLGRSLRTFSFSSVHEIVGCALRTSYIRLNHYKATQGPQKTSGSQRMSGLRVTQVGVQCSPMPD